MKNIIQLGETNLKTQLMNRMIVISNRLSQEINQLMKKELSISLAKFEVLVAIVDAENNRITMSDLSRKLLVSNANMTGMTNRLQLDGFIEKRSLASDRRIFSVALTKTGKDIFEKAALLHEQWSGKLMSSLSSEELISLNELLDKAGKEPA